MTRRRQQRQAWWLMASAAALCAALGLGRSGSAQQGVPASGHAYQNLRFGFSIAKPEPWLWYLGDERPKGEFLGVWIDTDERVARMHRLALIARFPLETHPTLLSPRVEAKVYELSSPYSIGQAVQDLLENLHSNERLSSRLLQEPTTVDINGIPWTKVVMSALVPVGKEPASAGFVHTYLELYLYKRQHRLFLVHFLAKTADVPTYRQDAERIIQSVTISAPGRSGPARLSGD